uniref:Uncharacterized protein n=1 Tax=Myoviridae sp. ctCo31 TaxID=2825053 RepID=A0A8S5UM46_9CAUD|nr:MAG TPA: hypothetical protein [Myoviridae sp. ctCo31]
MFEVHHILVEVLHKHLLVQLEHLSYAQQKHLIMIQK